MADEQTPSEGAGQQAEEPDYKALYEQEKAHSRAWERKAKANKTAADELAQAQEAGKTAEERIAELTKRLDEKEKAEKRAKLAAKVAEEKGIPADLVVGDDEEHMKAFADRMLKHFQKKPAPSMPKPGSFDRGGADKKDQEQREFVRELFGTNK